MITEAQHEQVLMLRQQGYSLEEICGIVDISYRQVRRVLHPDKKPPRYVPSAHIRVRESGRCIVCRASAMLNHVGVCIACQVRAAVGAGLVRPFASLPVYEDQPNARQ